MYDTAGSAQIDVGTRRGLFSDQNKNSAMQYFICSIAED